MRLKKTTISVTMNETGAASVTSANIFGCIKKIYYVKDTVNAETIAVTTITTTGEQVDSININTSAKQIHYPVVARTGVSAGDNKWTEHVVHGTLTVTVTGGAASKHFYVYVYYYG